jgi:hypothetical protein
VCSCQYRCRRCGSYKGYSSRSRNFIEKFLIPLLLLRSARCGNCFRRSYVLRCVKLADPEPVARSGMPS